MDKEQDNKLMKKIISLSKNRGFIFQAGELYGGMAGIYDYGPLGSLLKNNIKNAWIKKFVENRRDMFLLDSAIIMGEKPLTASGHVGGFSDPLVRDIKTGIDYRADHLLEDAGIDNPEDMTIEEMNSVIQENNILSPDGNKLEEVREFNLMLKTFLGPVEDEKNTVYFRPETAQGIFINFKNILDTTRKKIPFGIAQIGKAFRNEITPGNFIFRTREFEQMEIEYFIEKDWEKHFQHWQKEIKNWIEYLGIKSEEYAEIDVPEKERAHRSEERRVGKECRSRWSPYH